MLLEGPTPHPWGAAGRPVHVMLSLDAGLHMFRLLAKVTSPFEFLFEQILLLAPPCLRPGWRWGAFGVPLGGWGPRLPSRLT